ncbi:MAG TPA: F0F1 ATP synthase subunit delta [Gallionellaceae bacterium]|nr:F0F1 ATP synthase subunit delta [Gallionellaceae bacterium]
MLIDWFTVVAQVANFLILVWLMKRFLYKPILNALDAREKRIAATLADADAKEAEAARAQAEYAGKNEAFDAAHAELLGQAAAEAADERRRLTDAAREESAALRATLLRNVESEYHALQDEIARRTRREAFDIARKALQELAGVSLEARMAEVFVARLRQMEEGARRTLGGPDGDAPAVVRSAFELDAAQRAQIEAAIREMVSATAPVRFETVPELVGGIELFMAGQKAAWSIGDHLAALDKDVEDLLRAQRQAEAASGK